MGKNNISVLIPTYNEEKNIRYALESVSFASEVFVVDSFSSDATQKIVEEYPYATFVQHKFENYSKQKNWALDTLPFTNEWILILDADEQITSGLQGEILNVISKTNDIVAYYINRRFIFLKKWIRYCGWYPSWNLRLFKKGRARYEERSVNEHMIAQGRTGYLKHDMLHDNHKSLAEWIEKHNKYSTMEAEEYFKKNNTGLDKAILGSGPVSRKRALKEKVFYRLPFRPLVLFLYLYVFRLGFLDGAIGFIFCCLRAVQQFHIDVKIKEIQIIRKHGK
jgi:glycosyltransferase involved in cell wall biosynthesis